jgi:hypothetical protein
MMMINEVALEQGIKKNWEDTFQLIDVIGIAVDAIEETEAKKFEGYSSNLEKSIFDRDGKIRLAINQLNLYDKKYSVLTRPVNKSSFTDCVKALRALSSSFGNIWTKKREHV